MLIVRKRNYYSIGLPAVTYVNHKFMALLEKTVTGVFDNCPLRRALTSGKIKIPEEKYVPGSTYKAPFVFHGDEAFALTEYLMRPIPRAQLQERQENDVFRYRLSRARMAVECSFGSIVTTFRLLGKAIETNVENAVHIFSSITLLHNDIRDLESLTELDVHKFTALRADPRAYMPPSKRNNASTKKAVLERQKFFMFFKLCPFVRT
jgi:hypothetical protein